MIPVFCNPDIVQDYSEFEVETLHHKNLLLLGEDRFLSTLMLRTFPRRKTVFVSPAVCKTVVPDEFSVLLSQRRRWINSTIHNLMELLFVRDLCGVFCLSMQFVIMMDLIATILLPGSLIAIIYIIVISATSANIPLVSFVVFCTVLGLPAVLILIVSGQISYVLWMIVYLISLPIWTLVLPLYSFWRMDDFSWYLFINNRGTTRKTTGDIKGDDHGKKDGEFDGSDIHLKLWLAWMKSRPEAQANINGLEEWYRETPKSIIEDASPTRLSDDFSDYASTASSFSPFDQRAVTPLSRAERETIILPSILSQPPINGGVSVMYPQPPVVYQPVYLAPPRQQLPPAMQDPNRFGQ